MFSVKVIRGSSLISEPCTYHSQEGLLHLQGLVSCMFISETLIQTTVSS